MMKKVISLVLALTFIFALTGCTNKNMGRIMYNYKMEKFVELGEYKNIKIDTKGDEYKKTYDDKILADIRNYDLYVKITEGKLKKGDVANIDYTGKINGVAFNGGTAEGQELELGSNAFIPGFEDKLIGVEIGKTVDIDITFPSNYHSSELAGKAVVFTVKVNFVVIYDKFTEGTLKNGDVANIDFEGKLNGVAFDGGTSKGYDLELGSGSFIDGFEEKLVGVKIGSTVDLDLKFPENYGNEELNGKAVVFTVKVNYVKQKRAKTPEEYYKEIGYKTVEEYYEAVKKDSISNIILTKIFADSKIKKYPKKEKEMLVERQIAAIEESASAQGVDVETLVQYYTGMSFEEYKEWFTTSEIEPYLQSRMVIYAIFDDLDMRIEAEEFEKFIKKEVASYKDDKVTEKTLKEENGEEYFEVAFIQEKVIKYLTENAKIS